MPRDGIIHHHRLTVEQVIPGSPADGKLEPGDILVRINGELITEFRPYRTQVMPFFSNLLPEEHLRTYLAERAGVKPMREFFLLWALGMDLPGAITIRSADGEAWPQPRPPL